jgi:hypothetical protein
MIAIMQAAAVPRLHCAMFSFVERFPMPSVRRLIAVSAVLVFAGASLAVAQNAPGHPPMEIQGTVPMASHPGMSAPTRMPTMPGQEAFGTIQEIVQILEADPKTDWSKVDLEALRQHLIDMNEVTLKAEAAPKLAVMAPVTSRQIGAFIPLVVAASYAVVGLWQGLRFIVAGAVIAGLTLGGFFPVPPPISLCGWRRSAAAR